MVSTSKVTWKMNDNYFKSMFAELFKRVGVNGYITTCNISTHQENCQYRYTYDNIGNREYIKDNQTFILKIEAVLDGIPEKIFAPKPRVFEKIEMKEYSLRDIESLINFFSIYLDDENSKNLCKLHNEWRNKILTEK